MLKTILDAAKAGVKWVQETLDIETLSEGGETSRAQNESSVVMYGNFDGQKVLLTGDAGLVALARAHAYATSIGSAACTTCGCSRCPITAAATMSPRGFSI